MGLGYIGLPTAAMLAARKIHVIGVDVNPRVVETINSGAIHFIEPDLDILVHSVVKEGYLRATLQPEPAEAFLIAVPTPFQGDHHEPDLRFIRAAALAIAPVLKQGNLVVLESTSPVGTTGKLCSWLAEARPDLRFPHDAREKADVLVAYCPERVLPGRVIQELVTNDRIIAGMSERCSARTVELYRQFVKGECMITDPKTAELAKLSENSFRDVNIAFANELSKICEKHAIDVWNLIKLANHHPRVNILRPGPGVGGHCIAIDPWFIVAGAPEEARLIRTSRQVNDSMPAWVLQRVKAKLADMQRLDNSVPPDRLTVACYGASFKPDIDDLRESPALEVIRLLRAHHSGRVVVVEPHTSTLPADLGEVQLLDTETALSTAHLHVVLVAHASFRDVAFPDHTVRIVRS